MVNINSVNNLDTNKNYKYTNAIYLDNKYLILDDINNFLYIYDDNYKLVKKEKLAKNYRILTYNAYDKQIVMSDGFTIDLLNDDFSVDKKLTLTKIPKNIRGRIVDIFYYNGLYYLINKKYIYIVDMNGIFKEMIFDSSNILGNKGYYYSNCHNYCYVEDNSNISLTSFGIVNDRKYFIYNRNKSNYLVNLSSNNNVVFNSYLKDDTLFSSIIDKDNKIGLLGDSSNGSKDIYAVDSNVQLDKINQLLSDIHLKESGIADIISVEASKIKKILNVSSNVQEILNANESVKDTLDKAYQLEEISHKDLELLLDIISKM